MKLKALLPKTTEYAAEFHKRKQTGVATMKENYTSACRLNSWQISVLGVWKSTSSSSERTLSDDYHTLFCEGSHMEHPAHTHAVVFTNTAVVSALNYLKVSLTQWV